MPGTDVIRARQGSTVLSSAIHAISSAIRTLQETNHTAVIDRLREALQMLTADNDTSDDIQQEDIESNRKAVDAQDEAGWTALHRACEDGDLASVEMLVAAGADVNLHSRPRSVNEFWNTAVQLAARGGHADILRHLITAGAADVNARLQRDWTTLHQAYSKGHLEVVQILLAAGADVRALTSDDRTSLHMACRYGHLDIVKALLDVDDGEICSSTHSIDEDDEITDPTLVDQSGIQTRRQPSLVNMQTSERCTALDVAIDNSHYDVVWLLLAEGSVNIRSAVSSDWQTILNRAARSGQAAIVERILAVYAQVDDSEGRLADFVNVVAANGCTALTDACNDGYVDVVRVLLSAGADASLVSHAGWTPAMNAAFKGHTDVLVTLLTLPPAGSSIISTNVDFPGPDDWTALHFAATRGRAAAIRVLLDHGADINARSISDYTPLFLVCRGGHAGLIQTLLDAGADLASSLDRDGISPLGIADERGHVDVVRALLDFAADDDRAAALKLVLGDKQSLIVELLKPSSTSGAVGAAVDGKLGTREDEQDTDCHANTETSDNGNPASGIEHGRVDVTTFLNDVGRLEVREESQADSSHC